MTRFTQSNPVGNFITEFYKRCKWLDVVRMNFNSSAIAFVVVCSAILAGVIVSLVNSRPPFFVFSLTACYIVLMGFINMPRPFCFIGFLCRDRSNRKGHSFGTTYQRTVFSFPAFFFIFRHGLMAIKTIRLYIHTIIADAFYFYFYPIRRESFFTNQTSSTDEMSVSVEMGSTSPTSGHGLFALFGNTWCCFATVGAWLKSLFVTRLTNPIIPSVVFTYLTSIFHVSILPQVTNEYNYE